MKLLANEMYANVLGHPLSCTINIWVTVVSKKTIVYKAGNLFGH